MLRKCLGFVIGTEIHRKNLVTRNTRYRFFKNFRWIVRTAQEKSPVSLIPVFCWVRMNSKRKIELKDSVWPLVRKKQGRNPKLSLKVKKANPWISRSSWSLIFYLLLFRGTKIIGPPSETATMKKSGMKAAAAENFTDCNVAVRWWKKTRIQF